MKIEKINDNQIRCTLTKADLAARELHLSELAYGTEKARALFHDMMEQAAEEYNFETGDMPLMIEAIPSKDSIVLVITKVDDPDELDTRFSNFAPQAGTDTGVNPAEFLEKLDGAESILNLLDRVREHVEGHGNSKTEEKSEPAPEKKSTGTDKGKVAPAFRLFSFGTMDNVIGAAHLLGGMYTGANTLYKDPVEDIYLLALTRSDHTENEFNRICNMLTEYGSAEKSTGASLAFLEEHCEVILASAAMQQLATI